MQRPIRWILGCLAVAAAVAVARPIAAQGEAITLVYKYKPGRAVNATTRMNGRFNMNLGLAGQPQNLDMTMDMTLSVAQRVTGVAEDGTGTVNQNVSGMQMDMSFAVAGMPMKMNMRLQNGRLVMTINGAEVPIPEQPGQPSVKELTQPTTMKISPTGKIIEAKGGAASFLGSLPGGSATQFSGIGGLPLPGKPVAVGGTWETRDQIKIPVGAAGAPGVQSSMVDVEFSTRNKLRAIEERGGRKIAVIDTDAKVTLPRGAKAEGGIEVQSMEITIKGVSQFDIEAGEPTNQSGDVGMTMKMKLTMGAQQGTIDMKGTFKLGTIFVAAR